MTRENAKSLFRNDKNTYGQVRAPMRKLDQIFDSLDKQICLNCSHSDECEDADLLYCHELGIEMSKTFGCIYFNEKDEK